jgi:hypothetical protein
VLGSYDLTGQGVDFLFFAAESETLGDCLEATSSLSYHEAYA